MTGGWRKGTALLRWIVLILPLCLACVAQAQNIESVVSPGDLIQGHAKWEQDCKQCHVMFDREAQDRQCTQCHKEIGRDASERRGFHGLMKRQACRACHTDHKGRGAAIAVFETSRFDHNLTAYALRGKHQKGECKACHEAGKKYRLAPHDCNACHKKHDLHKGTLGPKCADCHTENNWKEAKLDHDKTRFALAGKHIDVKCAACHKDKNYRETPHTCVACHKKDDEEKKGAHRGQFGEKCETCHDAKAWKPASRFNHDADTKYALQGKHRVAKCAACHSTPLYKTKTSQACFDCHQKDDKHKDTLGRKCGACHTERSWKESPGFDHARSQYPLLGKHAKVECKACHKSVLYKEAPKDCIGCHRKDDKHEATLGARCELCHSEREWKETSRFDHGRSRFPLRNAHAQRKVQCKDCHTDIRRYRATPLDCFGCHQKHDKHESQLGRQCEQCHGDQNWKVASFEHGRTRLPLTGRHVVVPCKDCHASLRYKDARTDCYGCHQKKDKHELKFGSACEKCHNARAWPIWDFNHDTRGKYRLEGKHRSAACEACHRAPAPAGKDFAPLASDCLACHRRDDVHEGGFGAACDKCHTVDHWKELRIRVGPGQSPRASAKPADARRFGQAGVFGMLATGEGS